MQVEQPSCQSLGKASVEEIQTGLYALINMISHRPLSGCDRGKEGARAHNGSIAAGGRSARVVGRDGVKVT
jgi:hypothetical protein